jgi:hypothetical protein
MKPELTLYLTPFARSDQSLVRVSDGMQRSIQLALPELQEPRHLRKVGSKIVFLPDERLEHGLEIRHAVKDVSRSQSVAMKLSFHI